MILLSGAQMKAIFLLVEVLLPLAGDRTRGDGLVAAAMSNAQSLDRRGRGSRRSAFSSSWW